jgi:hypothetical protein
MPAVLVPMNTPTRRRPPAPGRRLDGIEEPVLLNSKLSQAVVAAIEYLQRIRQALRIHAGYFADVSVDFHGLELAARQSAALLDEGGQRRRHAPADAASRRILCEQQRFHGFPGNAERSVTGLKPFELSASSRRGNTSRITGLPLRLCAA